MKTIHKFRIETGKEPTVLNLKEGYRVVRCEYILPEKAVYLWVEQPLNVSAASVERKVRVVYSGQPVPDDYQYLGTALDAFGPEAYHLYELPGQPATGVEAAPKAGAERISGRPVQLHRSALS
ncbi:MAG: hypothetical protein R3280_11270 [Marinobacter sp.]|uniref:DUF7352 domain-containing protein n=1 Tax=Marinobacter sp. TaxID=50741 RepID=UPI00299F4F41|nr:hypothetical protein [Marinobacter sp.]MDX1635212.1 hypothetical protein [Marinobacter sp.]